MLSQGVAEARVSLPLRVASMAIRAAPGLLGEREVGSPLPMVIVVPARDRLLVTARQPEARATRCLRGLPLDFPCLCLQLNGRSLSGSAVAGCCEVRRERARIVVVAGAWNHLGVLVLPGADRDD